jgi:hypothetical protein
MVKSPKGRLFPLGSYLNITEVANFLGYFIEWLHLFINIDKNGLGYILGYFFTNSSGHHAIAPV